MYIIIIMEGFIERKIDKNLLMHLSPSRDSPGTDTGQHQQCGSQGMTKVGECQSKQVSLELASKTIYCLLACDSLWQPVPFNWYGAAKPCLPMCFLGWVEETGSRMPRVRLLDLIKANRYGGWAKLIALKTRRLYLKKIRC